MSEITNDFLAYSIDSEGVATININQVNEPANLLSLDFIAAYLKVAQQAIQDEKVKGVVVTSARPIFMAGGDLRQLSQEITDPGAFTKGLIEQMHQPLRAIETGGKPFAAAINGTCLGGGMELALTCHYRIALNSPKVKLGFPESKVGLLPGGGGTAKAPYLMGLQTGLTYLLQGVEARPQKALKDGLIHAVADTQEELLAAARKWVLENPNAVQPWDEKRYKIPGGGVMTPNGMQTLAGAVGNVTKLTHGNYPALRYILKVVHDGLQIPIDRALEIEARYFTKILRAPEAKNMIRTAFFEIQKARKGKARPADQPPYEVKKIGLLGAGMMGAGIAYVSAKVGMDVVLKDVTQENAEKGKAYSEALLKKSLSKGYTTQEKMQAVLDRIVPTADPAAVADCDLIIEAVFENPDLKATVTKETEAVFPADKIYASNTSTIPITLLAGNSERPENFIGIHFFSPVDKMPLVEIIVGEKTSDKAIAAAIDYTVAIKKIPIVVNDSRGFFTSRCFGTFVNEGMFLLEEGVPAAMIENVARKKGMAVGPLAVHDEVTLTLSLHVIESNPDSGNSPETQRAYKIIKQLVDAGRTSKKDGAGFYEYPAGAKKFLWPELKEMFNSNLDAHPEDIVSKRILHRQALESYRCLDEGVLRSTTDGDIGSVLGWGFPIYTGGSLSYIDYYGMKQFVADCDLFAAEFGDRWIVPDSLRKLMEQGKSVHQFSREVTMTT